MLAVRLSGDHEPELGSAERAQLGLALDQFRRTLPRRHALSTVGADHGVIVVAVPDRAALGEVARDLGITHVAVDVAGLDATDDPYEAAVGRLWKALVSSECTEVLREGEYALFALRDATAYARAAGAPRG